MSMRAIRPSWRRSASVLTINSFLGCIHSQTCEMDLVDSDKSGEIGEGSRRAFARRLIHLREKAGISRRELARSLRITEACVWQWEERGVMPRRGNLAKLAAALHVTPDFLRFGEENIGDLDKEILEAKQRIAAAAGLAPSKVLILLDQ